MAKNIVITLDGVLVDRKGRVRPYAREFLQELRDNGFSVFLQSSRGIATAEALHQQLSLPTVDGFYLRGYLDRQYVQYMIDDDAVFMSRYPGFCVTNYLKELDPNDEDTALLIVAHDIKLKDEEGFFQ